MIRCLNRGFNRTTVASAAVICGLAAYPGDCVRACFTPDDTMNLYG